MAADDSSSPLFLAGPCTRRGALWRCAGLLSAPLLVAACGRDEADGGDAADAQASAGPQTEAGPGAEEARTAASRPGIPPSEPIVRVRIARVRGGEGAAVLGDERHWLRAALVHEPRGAVVMKGPLRVTAGPEGWLLGEEILPRTLQGQGDLEVSSIDPGQPSLKVNGRAHPGVVRLVRRSDAGEAAFDIVNHVLLETYLPGVVGQELYPDWDLAAFMAQAVAARSFAAAESAWFSTRRHYDLTNTAHSQVYGGATEARRPIDSVIMTRGEVLEYEDRLVPGYYSSCCGGVSARAIDAIGPSAVNDVAPLHGRGREDACREAPVFSWTVERSAEAVAKRLAALGRDARRSDLAAFTRISSIEVAEANPHGRPRAFLVNDVAGSAKLAAEALREAVNSAASGQAAARQRLKSSNFTAEVKADRVVFRGNGFGHGVGLCQYGAQSLARSGRAYRQIVEWYYPGAGVVRGYG